MVGAIVTVVPSTVARPSTSRLKPPASARREHQRDVGAGGGVGLRVTADAVDDEAVGRRLRPHRQHVRPALVGHRDEVGDSNSPIVAANSPISTFTLMAPRYADHPRASCGWPPRETLRCIGTLG